MSNVFNFILQAIGMGKRKEFRKNTSEKKSQKIESSEVVTEVQTSPNVKNIAGLLEKEDTMNYNRKKRSKALRKELVVNSPLIKAVEKGHFPTIQKLVKGGADIREPGEGGRNALMVAVSKKDDRIFPLLWDHIDKSDVTLLNQADDDGYTLLSIVVQLGNVKYVNLFCEIWEVDVNQPTHEGRTPLMLAAAKGHREMVRCLLDSGARVLAEDKFGATALCFAFCRDEAEIARILIEAMSPKDQKAYIQKRVALLSHSSDATRLEFPRFCKRVLFRVILEIKRSMERGPALLLKKKIFYALVKLLECNTIDIELHWIAFHLFACLMYDDAADSRYVVMAMAEQFVHSGGPDFCLKAIIFNRSTENIDIRGAAFLPIHPCIECRSGMQWLRNNYGGIREYMAEFKETHSKMKCWMKIERTNIRVMFERFEEAMRNSIDGNQHSSPVFEEYTPISQKALESIEKSSENLSSEVEEPGALPFSAGGMKLSDVVSYSVSTTSGLKKKKLDTQRRVKNIKFHAKFDPKIKMRGAPIKFTVKSLSTMLSSTSNLNSHTRYADALKKNLSHEDQERIELDSTLEAAAKTSTQLEPDSKIELKQHGADMLKQINEIRYKSDQISSSSKNNDVSIETYASKAKKNIKPLNVRRWTIGEDIEHVERSLGERPHAHNMNDLVLTDSARSVSLNFDSNSCQSKSNQTYFPRFAPVNNQRSDLQSTENNSTDQNMCFRDNSALDVKLHNSECDPEILVDVMSNSKDKVMESGKEITVTETPSSVVNELNLRDSFESPDDEDIKVINEKGCIYGTCKKVKMTVASRLAALGHAITLRDMDSFLEEKKEQNLQDKNSSVGKLLRQSYSDVTKTNIDHMTESKKTSASLGNERERKSEKYLEAKRSLVKNIGDDTGRCHSKKEKNFQGFCDEKINLDIKQSELKDTREASKIPMIFCEEISEGVLRPSPKHKLKADEECVKAHRFEGGDVMEEKIGNKQQIENILNDGQEPSAPKKDNATIPSCDLEITHGGEKVSSNLERSFIPKLGSGTNHRHLKSRLVADILQSLMSLEERSQTFMACKFKMDNLEKFLSLYHRLILRNFYNQHKLKYRNEKSCSEELKWRKFDCESFLEKSENEASVFTTKHPNAPVKLESSGVDDAERLSPPESAKLLEFIGNFSKLVNSRTPKCNMESVQKRPKNFSRRTDGRMAKVREEVLNKRRSLSSEVCLSCKDPSKIFDVWISKHPYCALPTTSIKCQSDSKWYPFLKRLTACVPLSYHLLVPDSAPPDSVESTSRSSLYRLDSSLGEVIFCSKEEYTLRTGKFGTYIGLRIRDGAPVVLRQFGTSALIIDEAALSLSKKSFLKHKNLCTFHEATISPLNLKLHWISELCEYSLPQYIKMVPMRDRSNVSSTIVQKLLIIDLLEGIRYLHEMKVVHGFLKPSNVMVTIDDKLKLSDYYLLDLAPLSCGIKILGPKIRPIGSQLSEFCWRPTELISAQNETEARANIGTASDIQMFGMLVYFILSGGMHPFGASEPECQENIQLGLPRMASHPEDTEARDLVRQTVKAELSARPRTDRIYRHPYFWDTEKRFQFLIQVGRKITFYMSRPCKAADDFRESCIETRDWTSFVHPEVLKYVSECGNKVYKNEFPDLLLFAVALQENFDFMPRYLSYVVQRPSHYILLTFPTFFISVYHVVRRTTLLQRQMALQTFF